MVSWAWQLLLAVIFLFPALSSSKYKEEEEEVLAPQFQRRPNTHEIEYVGKRARLQCRVKGKPRPMLTWYRNDQLVNVSQPRFKITRYALVIENVSRSDKGQYSCFAQNQHGKAWGNFTLIVKDKLLKDDKLVVTVTNRTGPPVWSSKKPNIKTVARPPSSWARLKCPVLGVPMPNITWRKFNKPVKENQKRLIRKWTLTIKDVVPEDAGNYTCIVSNVHGTIQWTYNLEVVQRVPYAPIIAGPKNQTVVAGETAKFECKVVVSDLQPHLQWLKHFSVNGSYLGESGEPFVRVIKNYKQSGLNISNPEVLFLPNVTFEDAGWYTCVASNSMGFKYQSAWLTVVEPEEATLFPSQSPVTMDALSKSDIYVLIAVIATFLILLCVVLAVVCIRRKKRHHGAEYKKRVIVMKPNDLYYQKDPQNVMQPLVPQVRIEGPRRRLSSELTTMSEYEIPLDKNWEFSRDRLIMGKQLGSGAFGVVMKAEAIGIGGKKGRVPVAVKMFKNLVE